MWQVYFLVVLISLCIGSFLNVVAYRVIRDESLGGRSRCPSCKKTIPWYDNIPLFSYIFLQGRCRHCREHITLLYPFVELVSALTLTALCFHVATRARMFDLPVLHSMGYGATYFIFLCSLIVTLRTDLESMLICQLFSLWLVPLGLFASWAGFGLVSFWQSVAGACIGYGSLWAIAYAFKYFRGVEGMGVGDMELLAMIGAFLGPIGVWITVMLGSISGVLAGVPYLLACGGSMSRRIPFGPFLVFGAMLYFFFRQQLIFFFL
jgi:leader peptidase (prepilin peptidase)/N-methyltransferase